LKRYALTAWVHALLMLLPVVSFASVIEVVDDTGSKVRLEKPAQRIVSLAPHITELLFAAGAGSRVVGTVSYSDYPDEALRIPGVGSYDNADMERILAAKPDLIVAWQSGNSRVQVARLKELGHVIYLSEPRNIEDVPRDIERLGELAGTPRKAKEAAAIFRERHAQLRQRYANRPVVSVFYQIWNRPLMTVNGTHLISQVIRLCGGDNVFLDLAVLAPMIDIEAVLKADPDAIVAGGMGESNPAWLEDWHRYPSLQAVRSDNLFFIPPSLLQRNGPRILDGAERMCQALDQARAKRKSADY
jgi:iron complex transport system substrate-binding protein